MLKIDNLPSPEALKSKATKMQAYLEIEPSDDEAEIFERLTYLGILQAQSGELLAQAKYYRDELINGTIMEALKRAYDDRLSASTINEFVKTAAKDYNYLVNWIDRINSSATHQMDALRTVISYRKEQMKL